MSWDQEPDFKLIKAKTKLMGQSRPIKFKMTR